MLDISTKSAGKPGESNQGRGEKNYRNVLGFGIFYKSVFFYAVLIPVHTRCRSPQSVEQELLILGYKGPPGTGLPRSISWTLYGREIFHFGWYGQDPGGICSGGLTRCIRRAPDLQTRAQTPQPQHLRGSMTAFKRLDPLTRRILIASN